MEANSFAKVPKRLKHVTPLKKAFSETKKKQNER